MTTRQALTIFAAVLLIIGIISASIFEIREVTDANWKDRHFSYFSKDPYGTFVLADLIRQKYGDDNTKMATDTIFNKIDSSGHLYVHFGMYTNLDSVQSQNLISFLSKGNEALFITKDFYVRSNQTGYWSEFGTGIHSDTSLQVNVKESDESFLFKYYYDDFDQAKEYNFDVIELNYLDDSSSYQYLFTLNDSLSIFGQAHLDGFPLYMHSIPLMFTNMASEQSFYLNHINAVFNHFQSDRILLDHYSFTSTQNYNQSSPIQFILSTPTLSWAYYSFLLLLLLFIWFKGKRVQKPIPAINTNTNTTLEYIGTLSRLHFSQNQNAKLVLHMRDIFHHKVKAKYFLDKSNPYFSEALSRKSKIPRREIDMILSRFKNAQEKFDFDDLQLSKLYTQIETLYKNWK